MKSTRVPGLHDLMTVKIMNAMTINNSANGIGPCTRVEHPIVHRRTQYFHKIQSKIQVAQHFNIATLQRYNITISTMDSSTNTKLQTLNYVNVLAYVSNFLVVFGSTAAGLPDNGTLSKKYQTLVTPAGYAFSIWGVIFLAELIWTIGQLFPAYRSTELVVKGVGYNFALACFAQCAWTVLFGLEKMTLSLVAMICILIPLVSILTYTNTNSTTTTNSTTIGRYWLLKFPFEIHAAWIMAATLVNTNVVFVAYGASPKLQLIVGLLSLITVFSVGFYYTLWMAMQKKQKRWVVPCVMVWASYAIASELSNPQDMILATFSESTIRHTKVASQVVAAILLLITIVEAIRNRFFVNSSTINDEVFDSDNDNNDTGGSGEQYSSLN